MTEPEPRRARARLRLAGDPVVVELARLGDRDAFEELVHRRAPAVRGLLRRLCGNAALADDLGQETFVAAWRSLPTLQSVDAIGGWLRRIAVRVWARHTARQRPDVVLLADDTVAEWADDAARSAEANHDLDTALARLAPAPRVCMVLAYQAGMSHGEIAATTGLPLGTVKTHITRSTQALRQWFGVTDKE